MRRTRSHASVAERFEIPLVAGLIFIAVAVAPGALLGAAYVESSYVTMPGGLDADSSKVHRVTFLDDGRVLVDDGRIVAASELTPLTVDPPTHQQATNNWVAYAWGTRDCFWQPWPPWFVCESNFRALVGYWNIPAAPQNTANVLLYIFNGMQPTGASSLPLIQPVLQWGFNGAFGGQYWSVASWHVWGSDQDEFAYSTPIENINTDTYDTVHGGIGWQSQSGPDHNWGITSTLIDVNRYCGIYWACPATTLTATMPNSELGYLTVVLEGYHRHPPNPSHFLHWCTQLPSDIFFTQLRTVHTDGTLKGADMDGTVVNMPCAGLTVHIHNEQTVDIHT